MEGKHYATILSIILGAMHYANYEVNGHNYGLAWKPAIAAMPLATIQNAMDNFSISCGM